MLIEILIFIGAAVAFVNSLFILMLVLAVGKLIKEVSYVRSSNVRRNIQTRELLDIKICKLTEAIQEDMVKMKNKIDQLFVSDHFTGCRILKHTAVEFRKLEEVNIPLMSGKAIQIMTYFTTPEEAGKRKEKLTEYKKKVEDYELVMSKLREAEKMSNN